MLSPNRNENYSKMLALMANTVEMLDFSRALSLFYHAMQCQEVPGDVVEFGCNRGHTAKILSLIFDKKVWVYDSFEGLPGFSKQDEPPALGPGTLKVSTEELIANFAADNIRLPTIVKGWFKDVRYNQLPTCIAFAHIDGDFYQSTLDALEKVWPFLSPNGVIVTDDFRDPSFPGVESAVRDFFGNISAGAFRLTQPWGTDGNRTTHAVITRL